MHSNEETYTSVEVEAPVGFSDVPFVEVDVTAAQILSKTTSMFTDRYNRKMSQTDFTDTNWTEVFSDNCHYTPLQLIQLFRYYLQQEILRYGNTINKSRYEHLIQECKNWENGTVITNIFRS